MRGPLSPLSQASASPPASVTPSGQPSTTPTIGTPPKNSERCQSGQRFIAAGPPSRWPSTSNIPWITPATVRQTMKFLPYHVSTPPNVTMAPRWPNIA